MPFDALTPKQGYELLRSQLELDRSSFTPSWRDIADHILPRRARFQLSDVNKGDRRNQKIIDSTATFAARTFRAGMQSGLASPARPWFHLGTPDPDLAEFGTVKEWLHQVTQRMNDVFLRSNLYRALPIVYGDVGTFATGAVFVAEDPQNTIRCKSFPIGSYLVANDHNDQVRTCLREFRMTARQLVERFGGGGATPDWSRFSNSVRSAWDSSRRETWFDVVHVIQPNSQHQPDRLESKYKAFISCYYEKAGEGDQLLEEMGFDEFPVLVPRWETTGEDAWGTESPGWVALGDIKALQLMRKRGSQVIEKQLNPPMVASPAMRASALTQLPGQVNYVTENQWQSFRPAHEVKVDLGDLRIEQQDIRQLIQRAYYMDLFLAISNADEQFGPTQKTATEIMQRHEEKLLVLGPVIEQLNGDLYDPLIDRTFNIMLRRGDLPRVPQELEGVPLKVEYISIMAQAQKAVGLSGIDRFGGFVSSIASIKEDAWDKVNTDEMIDEYAIATGVPPRFIVDDEQVAAVRAGRAKAAQQAQQAEDLKNAGAAARDLSQADTSGDNALTSILANVGSAAPAGVGL